MGKKKSQKTDVSTDSTVHIESKEASKRQKPKPPAPLLDLVNDFLKQYPLERAARRLQLDVQGKRWTNPIEDETWKGASKDLPSLVDIYKQWADMQLQRTDSGAGGESVSKKSTKNVRHERSSSESDSESTSASSSAESSSYDSSSEDSASEASDKIARRKAATPTAKATSIPVPATKFKRKRPSSSTASTSSSSSADYSTSSADSDSEVASPEPKRRKTGQRKNRAESRLSSSAAGSSASDTSATSSSSHESSRSESEAQATSKPARTLSKKTADTKEETLSYSSSSSGGESTSESTSESEVESPPNPTSKASKKTKSRTDTLMTHHDESTESSVTLAAPSPVKKLPQSSRNSSSALETSSSKPVLDGFLEVTQKTGAKRKRSPVETAGGADDNLKRQKTANTPFTRVPRDVAVDPKFASNKYVPYDYAEKAHRDLIVTRGKGFTKEKNKKKRGSYRGGAISMELKGIKFDD